METNNPTVVELIKIIKDDIFNSSTKENAKLLTDKIDEITFEFAELEKIMNSDELESTLTQYGELLVLLVKNKVTKYFRIIIFVSRSKLYAFLRF
jgi:hypothetical protein